MFPFLNLFGFSIPMYSIMIGTGLAAGILFAVFRAKRCGLGREDVLFSCLFAIIGLIGGGKLLYLITVIPWLDENWAQLNSEVWLALIRGGFVFYGGLIGALLMIVWYVKMYRIPVFQMQDAFTP